MHVHARPSTALRRLRRLAPLAAFAAFAASAFAAPAAAQPPPPPARAELAGVQELLDAERPEDALARLGPILARQPDDAEALLLAATARLMLGEIDAGRRDLGRALELDPKLRRGWLNRAALDVAEGRYDDALAAFGEAEKLDPAAPENHLNAGAVLLLQGQLAPASDRFDRYLKGPGATGEGFYLVATNYALAGYAALAVEHLRQAVERDERFRRTARTDPNFQPLAENAAFTELLNDDLYTPPAGSYTVSRTFPAPYDGAGGGLLPPVLDALQLSGRPFDPHVEVTPRWALIWGELRIKVTNTVGGQGLVQISAPPDGMKPAEWRDRTEDLLRAVATRLALQNR